MQRMHKHNRYMLVEHSPEIYLCADNVQPIVLRLQVRIEFWVVTYCTVSYDEFSTASLFSLCPWDANLSRPLSCKSP